MRRFLITLAAVTVAAGCGDVASVPTSSLHPTTALLSGDPPPPPVGARGFADFDAFEGDASDMACSANASFNFSYQYFLNGPGKNSFLHIQIDQGPQVDIHQTDKKIDAHGTITGAGFTFDIQNVVGGSIQDPEERVPFQVSLQLTGKLTTETGTCIANATLNATLRGEIIP